MPVISQFYCVCMYTYMNIYFEYQYINVILPCFIQFKYVNKIALPVLGEVFERHDFKRKSEYK